MRNLLRVSILIVMLLSALTTSAQSYLQKRTVAAVEAEIGIGAVMATHKISQIGDNNLGVGASVELRYNFAKVPVDLGLSFAASTMSRGKGISGAIGANNFDSQTILLTSSYNFFQGRGASIFLGLGMGVAFCDRDSVNSGSITRFCAMPRVGVEFAQRIRLFASYKVYEKANNQFMFGVGFVLGGGKRD